MDVSFWIVTEKIESPVDIREERGILYGQKLQLTYIAKRSTSCNTNLTMTATTWCNPLHDNARSYTAVKTKEEILEFR